MTGVYLKTLSGDSGVGILFNVSMSYPRYLLYTIDKNGLEIDMENTLNKRELMFQVEEFRKYPSKEGLKLIFDEYDRLAKNHKITLLNSFQNFIKAHKNEWIFDIKNKLSSLNKDLRFINLSRLTRVSGPLFELEFSQFTEESYFDVGVLCGQKTGLIVIEIDDRKNGIANWKKLTEITGCFLGCGTLHVQKGNGLIDIYFGYNKKVLEYQRTQDDIWPGINIRNDDSFVMAPYCYDKITLIQNKVIMSLSIKGNTNVSPMNEKLALMLMSIQETDDTRNARDKVSTESKVEIKIKEPIVDPIVKRTNDPDENKEIIPTPDYSDKTSIEVLEIFFQECISGKVPQVLEHLKSSKFTNWKKVISTINLHIVYEDWCILHKAPYLPIVSFTSSGTQEYLTCYNNGTKTSVGGKQNSGSFYFLDVIPTSTYQIK